MKHTLPALVAFVVLVAFAAALSGFAPTTKGPGLTLPATGAAATGTVSGDDNDGERDQKRPCKPMKKGDTVQLDFDNAPLKNVARLVSCLTGENLMFQPGSLGSKAVTVVSTRPVSKRDVWRLFTTALLNHQLKLERRGGFYVIMAVSRR